MLLSTGIVFEPAPIRHDGQKPGRRPPWLILTQFPFADRLLAYAHLPGHSRLGHIQVLSQRLDPTGIPAPFPGIFPHAYNFTRYRVVYQFEIPSP